VTEPAAQTLGGRPRLSVMLCIPSYRRPEGLRRLLTHVGRVQYRMGLSVLVVDNDVERREASATVAAVAPSLPYPVTCVIEARRGQTYAYNRAFLTACRSRHPPEFVAVLDDDEYPDPAWLEQMVGVAMRFGADIVGGPVFPVFANPDHWLAKSDVYQPQRYPDGPVPLIYGAGSMLIKRVVLAQYLDEPFSHEYAFTGGSDLDFFKRCQKDGRSFAWANAAHVFEVIPNSRLALRWLLRRGFRVGTNLTRVDRKYAIARYSVPRWIKGIGLLVFGILSLPISVALGPTRLVKSLYTAARGAGRLAAEFEWFYEEYR
jgi:succinoglycan biosynthesis protein ExoM